MVQLIKIILKDIIHKAFESTFKNIPQNEDDNEINDDDNENSDDKKKKIKIKIIHYHLRKKRLKQNYEKVELSFLNPETLIKYHKILTFSDIIDLKIWDQNSINNKHISYDNIVQDFFDKINFNNKSNKIKFKIFENIKEKTINYELKFSHNKKSPSKHKQENKKIEQEKKNEEENKNNEEKKEKPKININSITDNNNSHNIYVINNY